MEKAIYNVDATQTTERAALVRFRQRERMAFFARMVGAFAFGGSQAALVIRAFGLFGFGA